jgi:hypothetical protein
LIVVLPLFLFTIYHGFLVDLAMKFQLRYMSVYLYWN